MDGPPPPAGVAGRRTRPADACDPGTVGTARPGDERDVQVRGVGTSENRWSRWAVSLKRRTSHESGIATICEIDALSAPMNANASDPVASAIAWPMTPPCTTTTTRWPGCAETI